jgi:hypothetical protein
MPLAAIAGQPCPASLSSLALIGLNGGSKSGWADRTD